MHDLTIKKNIRAGFYGGLATWVLAIAFGIINIPWFDAGAMDWAFFFKQSIATVLTGVISGMVVGGALPLLAGLFQITTDMSCGWKWRTETTRCCCA